MVAAGTHRQPTCLAEAAIRLPPSLRRGTTAVKASQWYLITVAAAAARLLLAATAGQTVGTVGTADFQLYLALRQHTLAVAVVDDTLLHLACLVPAVPAAAGMGALAILQRSLARRTLEVAVEDQAAALLTAQEAQEAQVSLLFATKSPKLSTRQPNESPV